MTAQTGTVDELTKKLELMTEVRDFYKKKYRESERQKKTFLSCLPGMVDRCNNDKNWTMEFLSDSCAGLTGYLQAALINNTRFSFNDLIHPDDREDVWDQVQTAVSHKRSFFLKYRILKAIGSPRMVWEKGAGVYSENGELLAIEGYITYMEEKDG